jgi:hypothetical protein
MSERTCPTHYVEIISIGVPKEGEKQMLKKLVGKKTFDNVMEVYAQTKKRRKNAK